MNPSGLCQCGCGRRAPIADATDSKRGYVKGEPRRFVTGHQNKKTDPAYSIEDRGYTSPCWVWQRVLVGKGYGRTYVDGRQWLAHRWYWEQANGPIPDGLELDHLCRVRACVNPTHCEPVTHLENVRRGHRARAKAAA